MAASSEPLQTIIITCIHGGLRMKAEALSLRWEAVDLVNRNLHIDAAYAKSGKRRTIPINSTLLEALTAHRQRSGKIAPEDHAFLREDGQPLRDVRTLFERACKRAGIKGVTPHTCRHTFASGLVMAKIDLRTVQELGGWGSLRMVERYSHLSPAHLASAVEQIASPHRERRSAVPLGVKIFEKGR